MSSRLFALLISIKTIEYLKYCEKNEIIKQTVNFEVNYLRVNNIGSEFFGRR